MTNYPAPERSAFVHDDDDEPPFSAEIISAMLSDRKTRVDGWSPARVAAFIEILAQTGSVTRAADYAGMSVTSAYRLRARADCAAFAEAWNSAMATRHETLLDLAIERTQEGVERTRWYRGEVVGRERIISDQLLMFMIDRTDPSRGLEGTAVRRRLKPVSVGARLVSAKPGEGEGF